MLHERGLIAQHVALQALELVDKLALVVAAVRLSEAGRRFAEALIALAEAGRWPILINTGRSFAPGDGFARLGPSRLGDG